MFKYNKMSQVFKLVQKSLIIKTFARNLHQNVTSRQHCYIQKLSLLGPKKQFNIRFSSIDSLELDKDEYLDFMNVLPELLHDLNKSYYGKIDIPKIIDYLEKVLEYNIMDGKKNRAFCFLKSYKMLEKPENLTAENIRLANIMAWCTEMQQGFILICDDIIDQSEMRRGRLCWYKNPEIGLKAVRDGVFVQSIIYVILKKYFSFHPNYQDFVHIFHDGDLKTVIGQCLDIIISNNGKLDIDFFTMDRMKTMGRYKTGYALFHNPVILAMYMANYKDPEKYLETKEILLQIAELYQTDNDFIDCFINFGNDIQQGKCTWLAVTALEKANPVQKEILKEHYGKNNVESDKIIRQLYDELNLREIYIQYKKDSLSAIRSQIMEIKDLPQELFFKLLAWISAEIR